MNSIGRIRAILIQLQFKGDVKAHLIANRFSISFRTVLRDIKTLGKGIQLQSILKVLPAKECWTLFTSQIIHGSTANGI